MRHRCDPAIILEFTDGFVCLFFSPSGTLGKPFVFLKVKEMQFHYKQIDIGDPIEFILIALKNHFKKSKILLLVL